MSNAFPPSEFSQGSAEPPVGGQRANLSRPRVLLPLVLFVATCYTTYSVYAKAPILRPSDGLIYAAAIMLTLLCHEFGHFVQAVRCGVPASLPFFIPMPGSPIGTMGAVILMRPYVGDRRAIFDIGITGPLAGLVPALVFSVIGLQLSHVEIVNPNAPLFQLGEPLIFKALAYVTFGPLGPNEEVFLHPLAFAGWVGVFITALNLIPIGQLDGGHVLYGLLLRRSYPLMQLALFGAMLGVFVFGYWGWLVMLLLLMWMGPLHPPTANDNIPLGTGRTILGWATLCFVPIGFTPVPFSFGI